MTRMEKNNQKEALLTAYRKSNIAIKNCPNKKMIIIDKNSKPVYVVKENGHYVTKALKVNSVSKYFYANKVDRRPFVKNPNRISSKDE